LACRVCSDRVDLLAFGDGGSFLAGSLARNGLSVGCCTLTLRRHPALVAALGFCAGYRQPRAEMTPYPTLTPQLSQWLPREMVVDVGG